MNDTPALERERAAFEEEVRRWIDPARADEVLRREHEGYGEWGVLLAWECWKARAGIAAF